MPDHLHFFCSESPVGARRNLSDFLRQWKEWTAKRICKDMGIAPPVWQKGFFDHVLRSDESYADKWAYVRENPVRAGLVSRWDEWDWQGYVHFDHPAGV